MKERLPRPVPERDARPRETAPSPEQLWRAHAAWQAAPAMNDRTLRQWWDNVRLRWDCHSTAIEGSSLTYRDTLTVLVDGQVPEGRPALWEIDQIQGHNDAAYQLARWLNQGHAPDLEDLHAIHRLMLVRPYTAQAVAGGRMGRYVSPWAVTKPRPTRSTVRTAWWNSHRRRRYRDACRLGGSG